MQNFKCVAIKRVAVHLLQSVSFKTNCSVPIWKFFSKMGYELCQTMIQSGMIWNSVDAYLHD